MGCFNLNCAISRLPINDGENIVAFFIGEEGHSRYDTILDAAGRWSFMTLPMYTKMDDYGMSGHWGDCNNNKEEETWLKEQDKFTSWVFSNFRKHIYWVGKPDREDYIERDWYSRGIHYNDDRRHAAYFNKDPNTAKTDIEKWFSGKGTRVSPFFVRRDVYNYILNSFKVNKEDKYYEHSSEGRFIATWDGRMALSKLTPKTPEWEEIYMNLGSFERRNGISSELSLLAAEIIRNKELTDEEKDLFKSKYVETVRFTENLYWTQNIIQPNISMAPQGGWYRTEVMKPLLKYNKFIVKLSEQKLKKIKNES